MRWAPLALPLLALPALGCNTLLGLDPGKIPPATGGSSTTATTHSSSASTTCQPHTSECSSLVWARAYGDADTEHAEITGMGVDGTGSIVVAGYFGSTLTLGSTLYAQGSFDYFLAKVGPTGMPIWAKRFGSPTDDCATYPIQVSVTLDGQITLAGAIDGSIDFGGGPLDPGPMAHDFDVFVARFDDQGNHLWSKRFGSSPRPQVATQVAVDPAGDVLVAGWFQGSLDFGGGPLSTGAPMSQNGFLAKLAGESGAHVWSEALDAVQSTDVGSLAVDASGDLTVSGNLDGDVDLGTTTLTGSGAYFASFDGNGGYHWGTAASATGSTFATDASVDRNGFSLVAGTFGGMLQLGTTPVLTDTSGEGGFLVKLDPDGKPVWSKTLPSTLVITDGQSDVVIAGAFTESVDLGGGVLIAAGGSKDILLAKLDPNGAHLWSQGFGDAASQFATAVAVMPGSNRIVVAAAGGGSVDFGSGVLSGSGTTSVWLALFDP